MDAHNSASSRRQSAVSFDPSIHSMPSDPSHNNNNNNTSRLSVASTSDANRNRQPSIRIRRFPSYNSIGVAAGPSSEDEAAASSRRRSASDPLRTSLRDLDVAGQRRRGQTANLGHDPLPEIVEGTVAEPDTSPDENALAEKKKKLRKLRGSRLFRKTSTGTLASVHSNNVPHEEEYDSGLVDMLDLVDPEISTLNTLTNVQNSLFVPNLGRFINRRPTYTLTRRDESADLSEASDEPTPMHQEPSEEAPEPLTHRGTYESIASNPDNPHYAVLPHGVALEGWSAEDRKELNEHVRHMLHSRRSRFKRSMRGFRQYIAHPLGFFITLYATLITLFGLIWVLFLIGWIGLGSRKDYIINIIDNILVALFAIMGDGLAPFRAVDTYHMCFIAYYHHLTQKVRSLNSLPPLRNHNDLPTIRPQDCDRDLETGREMEKAGREEFSVLTEEQHARLLHHQKKFAKSHTFYKPHETATHHAFPIHFLIAAVVLLDLHSCLQISLGACTWGISYHTRPFALTTVILCCSITVNVTAGIVIMMGDRRTRKKDVLELMHKQELTAEAMRKLEKRREQERQRNEELDLPVPEPLNVPEVRVDAVDAYLSVEGEKEKQRERVRSRQVSGSVGGSGSGVLGSPIAEEDEKEKEEVGELEKFPEL